MVCIKCFRQTTRGFRRTNRLRWIEINTRLAGEVVKKSAQSRKLSLLRPAGKAFAVPLADEAPNVGRFEILRLIDTGLRGILQESCQVTLVGREGMDR